MYVVPMDLDVKMKAVMVGACFLIVSAWPLVLCVCYLSAHGGSLVPYTPRLHACSLLYMPTQPGHVKQAGCVKQAGRVKQCMEPGHVRHQASHNGPDSIACSLVSIHAAAWCYSCNIIIII